VYRLCTFYRIGNPAALVSSKKTTVCEISVKSEIRIGSRKVIVDGPIGPSLSPNDEHKTVHFTANLLQIGLPVVWRRYHIYLMIRYSAWTEISCLSCCCRRHVSVHRGEGKMSHAKVNWGRQ